MFYEDPNFWYGIAAGAVLWFLIQNLGLPDKWAIWLALRKNFPTAVLPIGIVLLAIALINLIVGIGWALIQALQQVQIAWWVWLALGIGIVVVALYLIVRHNRSARP